MIDKALDRLARIIELVLAFAFIVAVVLNFTNVVGRYLFGLSLLGSDEVQVFIMVAMTFLGAAVVTRRNLHLRMDVLVRFMPGPVQFALRIAEQVLLILLAGFVLSQSYFYAGQMLRIGRTSDMAGRSDVDSPRLRGARVRTDPADRVLAPVVVVTGRDDRAGTARRRQGAGMTFALFVVPVALLLIGFPIFMVLLTAVDGRARVLHARAARGAAPEPVRLGQCHAAARGAVLHLRGRADGARQRRTALVDFVQGGVGSVRGSLGVTAVGTSAIFGAISGASAATVATIGKVMVPAMRNAGYPETFTAGLITAVGAIDVIIPPSIPMIVYGAAAEESVARLYAAGVIPGLMIAVMIAAYVVWRAKRDNFGAGAAVRTVALPARRRRAASGRWARRSSSSAASTAACFRRPKPPRSPASTRRS